MIVKEHPEWPGVKPRDDLRYLGYWRGLKKRINPGYPDPHNYVDRTLDPRVRGLLVGYLQNQRHEVLYSWLGSSTCRFCGIRPIFRMQVAGEDRSVDFTDGTYAWPGGFGHYVQEHGVRPPEEFVAHVLRSLDVSL